MRLAGEADLTSWQLKEAFDAEVAARPDLLAADTSRRFVVSQALTQPSNVTARPTPLRPAARGGVALAELLGTGDRGRPPRRGTASQFC